MRLRPGPDVPAGAFLPYGRQDIDADDIAAVVEALGADYLTTGPRVEAFEQAFAATVGASFAIACSNGTAALHLSMLALGIGPGDRVAVPSVTFLASANCARFVGAEVLFTDVDPDTGLMTPGTLAAALEREPGPLRAVLPVHLRGDVADLRGIAGIAGEAGAVLVEDAPHALGSEADFGSGAEAVGSGRWSSAATFSFHPVKTIATGEGGMVTTPDGDVAARLRRLRSHGMERLPGADPWLYEMREPGFNYRLPDILCALGQSQLRRLPDFAARRRALAEDYAAALAPLAPHVRLAASPAWSRPVLHLLTALIDFEGLGRTRRQVVEALAAEGIGTQVHYIPVHAQPYYVGRYGPLDLPGAAAWYRRCLSLPLFPAMADGDVDRVADALARALGLA
jgi:UDP-4-amino-4,6-dideoxy-N-acetyl-beta-L-altrosamine transaminase